jgi:hypothetical protein
MSLQHSRTPNAHQKQNTFGVPCPAPVAHICVLHFVCCHEFRGDGCRLHYRKSLPTSPSQPRYVRIDNAYADWYRSRHGKEVDCSLVVPALNALQGHREAGVYMKSTSTRSSTTSISCTPHTSEVSTEGYDRRKDLPSMPMSRRHRCRLLRPYLLWRKACVHC